MKMLMLLALSFLSASAHADFTGTWTGNGEWTVDGQGTDCPVMKITFKETAQAFQRVTGFFDCGIVALHSDEQSWTKENGRLLFDGKDAGYIDPLSFASIEPYGEKVTIETQLKINASTADYLELWRDEKGREIYTIRGELARVQSRPPRP